MTLYDSGPLYGSGPLYTGSEEDTPTQLSFYRTDTDNFYVFHWTFQQVFISPALDGFDYQLQIDTDSNFGAPLIYETQTELASIVTNGRLISEVYAATSVTATDTLDINLNSDGTQTIILALNVSGSAIAADIQTKVNALTAANPVNQPAYSGFTASFNATFNQYTLVSGSTGVTSTIVVTGGTVSSSLKLDEISGGISIPGNSTLLSQNPRRILAVENSDGDLFIDVSDTANSPSVNQFIVNLTSGYVTFNDANVPDTITIIYVADTSEDITNFQRGNVAKGFTVEVYDRTDSSRVTFYARVRIKSSTSYGPFSTTLVVQTIEDVVKESADRLLGSLPDRHVYPTDEAFKPLIDRKSNIAKVFQTYSEEMDKFFLEKEHAIRDSLQERVRDERIFDILGYRIGYPKPSNMEFVDYRIIVSNSKLAALIGGTFQAVNLIGRAFTGVDPTIQPFSTTFNFITANETETVELISIPVGGPATATLTSGVRNDPIIPGSLTSGVVTTVSELFVIPVVSPYTVTLTDRPDNIPTIFGFTYTNDTPAAGEFAVNFSTKVLTFNSADAGTPITVVYIPFPDVGGGTLNINIDSDGVQTVTLSTGPFESRAAIAGDVQNIIRSVVAITPSNQPAYDNARVFYNQAINRFVIISGNQSPSPSSSVLITGGSAAPKLKLRLIDGASQTFGLTYVTPPSVPGSGEFRNNIDTGDGSALTFEGAPEYGKSHYVIYKKKSTIYTYLAGITTEALVVTVSSPYIVTLSNLPVDIPTIPLFTYTTGVPATGEFTVDFSTGILTFNSADASTAVSVSYTADTPTPPTLFSRIEAGFGIKIILNNPGLFALDLENIAFLLKKILPAHTKFLLVVN